MDNGMDFLSQPSIISIVVGCLLAGLRMVVPDRWRKWIGWPILVVSVLLGSLGTYCYLNGPAVVVTISAKQRAELGRPDAYKALVDQSVYQALLENGLVLWVDGRFFELGLDGQ